MATSGSIDYASSRDLLITEALELLGVLGEGESPSANQLTSCSVTLNYLVKHLQTVGYNLFTLKRFYLFPKKSTHEYTLNSSTTDQWTSDTIVQTALAADVSSAATSFTVDSITGISDGDYIGIEVASNVVHWTTVNGSPSGSTINVDDAFPDSASEDGAVYAYTNKGNRPIRITDYVRRTSDKSDTYLGQPLLREEYFALSQKIADGSINSIYYDPQVSSPTLFVWPETSDETEYLVLWCQRTVEDFDAAGNEPDFPQEWFYALSYNLAKALIPKFGTSTGRAREIRANAVAALEDALDFDREDSLKIQPDMGP